MKKKIIMIVACVMCCAGLFGGCGQSGMKQDNTAISNSEEGKQEGTTEEIFECNQRRGLKIRRKKDESSIGTLSWIGE